MGLSSSLRSEMILQGSSALLPSTTSTLLLGAETEKKRYFRRQKYFNTGLLVSSYVMSCEDCQSKSEFKLDLDNKIISQCCLQEVLALHHFIPSWNNNFSAGIILLFKNFFTKIQNNNWLGTGGIK